MSRALRSVGVSFLVLAALIGPTSGCGGGGGGGGPSSPLIYGLTDLGALISFRADDPALVLSTVPVTGLATTETLVGIDFRPANGVLYGVGVDGGNAVRIYTIATATGVATLVSTSPFTTVTSGTFGVDFNPVVDRIRVVSSADQNFRFNPDTGALTATDAVLAFDAGDPNALANPNVIGVAYSSNVAGATSTAAFAVDTGRDALITIGGPTGLPSANGGVLFTVGALGIDAATSVAGFDIHTSGGVDTAYLVTSLPGLDSLLFTVDLVTGASTLVSAIGTPDVVVAMAVQP